MWETFNVHMVWPDQQYEKLSVTALSKEDALKDTRIHRNIRLGAYPVKVIGPLGVHPTTKKQNLSHKYGGIYRNIEGAKSVFYSFRRMTYEEIGVTLEVGNKLSRHVSLVDSQFAKLQRDIRDLFKLAGLKVK